MTEIIDRTISPRGDRIDSFDEQPRHSTKLHKHFSGVKENGNGKAKYLEYTNAPNVFFM
jgi:hypothetical protein